MFNIEDNINLFKCLCLNNCFENLKLKNQINTALSIFILTYILKNLIQKH